MTRPAIGFKRIRIALSGIRQPGRLYAKWDGNPKRKPLAGELYISGAFPVAYRANVHLETEYFIAVEVED